MTWWQQLILVLSGAVVGSATSIATTLLTFRHQHRLEEVKLRAQEDIERTKRLEGRNAEAAVKTHTAIAALLRLPPAPSEELSRQRLEDGLSLADWYARYQPLKEQTDQWSTERDGLLLDLRMAAEGFANRELRQEIWWSNVMLQASALRTLVKRQESDVRRHVCEHMLRCIESSILGEGVPERSEIYSKCSDDMVRYYTPRKPKPDPS